MSNIVPMRERHSLGRYTGAQLDLIRKAHIDLTETEFNQFMHVAAATGLDPLRKQIYGILHNKDKPDKRSLTIIIGIDGYRTMAARMGDYMPADKPAEFVYSDELKGPANPLGIESVTVTVKKRIPGSDEYSPVVATAYWDEYAPIVESEYDWVETGEVWADSGKPKKKKVPRAGSQPKLDENTKWAKMPRQMLEKCATAKAIRSGWPDDFSGLYDEAEMDAPTLDLTATEIVEEHQREERTKKIGGAGTILFDFPNTEDGLAPVPVGKLADRIFEFLREHPDQAGYLKERNKHPLREFWAAQPDDALAVKREIERLEAAAEKEQANDPA